MHVNSRIPKPVRPRRRSSIRHSSHGGREESTVVAALPNVETRRVQNNDHTVRNFDEAHRDSQSHPKQPTPMAQPLPRAWSGKDWFRMTAGVLVSLLLLYIAFQSLSQIGKSPQRTVDHVPLRQSTPNSMNGAIVVREPKTRATASAADTDSIELRIASSRSNFANSSETVNEVLQPHEPSEASGETSQVEAAPLALRKASSPNEILVPQKADALSDLLEYPVTGFPAPGTDMIEPAIEMHLQPELPIPRLAQRPNPLPIRVADKRMDEQPVSSSESPIQSGELELPNVPQLNTDLRQGSEEVIAHPTATIWPQGETKLQGTIQKFPTAQ